MRVCVAVCLALGPPFVAAVQLPDLCADDAGPVCAPFRTLAKGVTTGLDLGEHVVWTQTGWEAFWARHDGGQPAPPVDLSREFVVALVHFHPNCCETLEVVEVVHAEGPEYVVSFAHWAGGNDDTHSKPFHMVGIARDDVGGAPIVGFAGMPLMLDNDLGNWV